MSSQQITLASLNEKLNQIMEQLGLANKEKEPLVVADIDSTLVQYHDYLLRERRVTEQTAKDRIRFVRHFLSLYPEITYEGVKEYLSKYQLEINPYNQRVKSLLPFLRDFSKRPDLVQRIKLQQEKFGLIDVPTKAELKTFYSFLRSGELKAIFLSLATSGLRREEILGLKIKDLNISTGKVDVSKVHTGKTKHSNFSFVNFEAIDGLRPFITNKSSEERIFSLAGRTVDIYFQQTSKTSGVKIRPKDLRSFFASQMLDSGVPEPVIDFLQGRLSKSVLRRHYLDYTEEKLKKHYDRANIALLS